MSINESSIVNYNNESIRTMNSSDHLKKTLEQLQRLNEINKKEFNTICIIGLEKAGKSLFINALVGFELLPSK